MVVAKVAILLSTVVWTNHIVVDASKNIVETAQGASPEFTVLVEALTKANLVTTLSGPGNALTKNFTVFAPTNAAFTAAVADLGITKAELLNRADLADILKYHVIRGNLNCCVATQLPLYSTFNSMQGKPVTMRSNGQKVTFGELASVVADHGIACSNGAIHTIDKVVFPPGTAATTTTAPTSAPNQVSSGAESMFASSSFAMIAALVMAIA